MFLKIVILYLLLLNLIGFISMRSDKRRAIAHGPRIPEKRLFTYAVLGGSLGCLFGMLIYRHKTKHLPFTLGLPVILLLQVFIAAAGYYCFAHSFQ